MYSYTHEKRCILSLFYEYRFVGFGMNLELLRNDLNV